MCIRDRYYFKLDLDEEQLDKYINILYDGIDSPEPQDDRSDLEKRMDAGYTDMLDKIAKAHGYRDGEGMKGIFNAANNINREKYGKDIPFKGVDITRDPKQNK